MELKERKKITNNKLPGFAGGTGYAVGGINMNVPSGQQGYIQPSYNMSSVNNPAISQTTLYNNGLTSMQNNIGTPTRNQAAPQSLNAPKAGSAVNAGPWFALGAWAGEGIGQGFVDANKSSDSFLQDAGTSSGSVAGFGYQKQNSVNTDQLKKDYDKQTALSFLTNPFEGLTRIFGRHQYEKRMRKANEKAERLNTFNRSGALSDYLAQQYATKYGDSDSQMLWAAARGKDKVESSIGKIDAKATARVAKDEPILDNLDNPAAATGHIVRNGKRGVDTNLANVNNSTVILGGDRDMRDGKKFQDKGMLPTAILEQINKYESRPSTANPRLRGSIGRHTDEVQSKILSNKKQEAVAQLQDLADQQAWQHQLEDYTGLTKAKRGKDCLPGFANGSNWWVDGLGVATGIGQMLSTAFQKVKKPNTYVANPYAGAALAGLAGLNINPYPMMQQMRDQERRNLYAINRAGGLSGAQKAFANIATGIGTQRNIADLRANIQAQNNQYKSNYYSTLLNVGQADRAARAEANRYDLDYFSKAHAAKLQMGQMGVYNMLNALQQGYANQFKRNQFEKTYDLYAQDVALNKAKTKAEIDQMQDDAAYRRRYLQDLRKKGLI